MPILPNGYDNPDGIQKSTRNQDERAFCSLKTSFNILTSKINLKLENIPTILYPCFVPHNFCVLSNIPLMPDINLHNHIYEVHYNETVQDNRTDPIYSCNTVECIIVHKCSNRLYDNLYAE